MPLKLPPVVVTETTTIERGWQKARCCALIDLGTQENKYEGDKAKKMVEQIALMFEFAEYGNARLTQIFTKTMHQSSKLRKSVVAWRGQDFTMEELESFELVELLNNNLVAEIQHKTDFDGSTVQKMDAFKPYGADNTDANAVIGDAAAAAVGEVVLFDIGDESTWSDFAKIPRWLQKIINEAQELKDRGVYLDAHGRSLNRPASADGSASAMSVSGASVQDANSAQDANLAQDTNNGGEGRPKFSPGNVPF